MNLTINTSHALMLDIKSVFIFEQKSIDAINEEVDTFSYQREK